MISTTTGVAMPETKMKLPARDATEAYLAQDGYICLRQTAETGDEAVIMLLPHDIPQVVEWLQGLAKKLPSPSEPGQRGAKS
jgi:hypothetical protein